MEIDASLPTTSTPDRLQSQSTLSFQNSNSDISQISPIRAFSPKEKKKSLLHSLQSSAAFSDNNLDITNNHATNTVGDNSLQLCTSKDEVLSDNDRILADAWMKVGDSTTTISNWKPQDLSECVEELPSNDSNIIVAAQNNNNEAKEKKDKFEMAMSTEIQAMKEETEKVLSMFRQSKSTSTQQLIERTTTRSPKSTSHANIPNSPIFSTNKIESVAKWAEQSAKIQDLWKQETNGNKSGTSSSSYSSKSPMADFLNQLGLWRAVLWLLVFVLFVVRLLFTASSSGITSVVEEDNAALTILPPSDIAVQHLEL